MPSLAQWVGLDKVYRAIRIIRHNGGIIGSIKKVYRIDELKIGTLVGEDKFGNKYYENNEYFHLRNRWVEYSDNAYLDYDASQIPPEWHHWMHYTTDIPPTQSNLVKYKWMIDHTENMSGTPQQYVPYSTTRQKIESWAPKESQTQNKLN